MTAAEQLAAIVQAGIEGVDSEQIGEWMLAQRWFSGKASELSETKIIDAIAMPGEQEDPLLLLIVETRTPAGTHDLYQLPVGIARPAAGPGADGELQRLEIARIGDSELYDALGDEHQIARLARLIEAEARVEGESSVVAFERAPGASLELDHTVRKVDAEQSNSSVVLGERFILKAFRRIEAGINPELEMLRFLQEHGFEHIAAVSGWYEYSGELLETTLGMIQRFVPRAIDGWQLVKEGLKGGTASGLMGPLQELGAITGQMHTALASDSEHPEFAPETPSDEHVALLAATIDEQIERMFVSMPESEALAPIRGRGEELRDLLAMLSHTAMGGRLIRCHGDYHLGQALRSEGDWIVLDFEGEPGRPLRERRRKRSPLRDVAGMLRSISYAALASELLDGVPPPRGWEASARARFLDGYMAEMDPALLPAGAQAIDRQLAMFELEKILYELRYELQNRPHWLAVPVASVVRLLEEEEES